MWWWLCWTIFYATLKMLQQFAITVVSERSPDTLLPGLVALVKNQVLVITTLWRAVDSIQTKMASICIYKLFRCSTSAMRDKRRQCETIGTCKWTMAERMRLTHTVNKWIGFTEQKLKVLWNLWKPTSKNSKSLFCLMLKIWKETDVPRGHLCLWAEATR
jgi:hypothetical protein